MAKSKKVLSLALAVVMAISMLSIGAFAAKTTPTATLTVSATTADGNPVTGPIQKGEAVTVTVAATASEDYFVGPTSVPVTYDPALFAVSNVVGANLFGEGTTEVASNDTEAGKVTVVITPLTSGEPVATNLNGANVTLYTFTLTAIADAGSCDVAVVNDQKTADNLTGKLYITSFDGTDPRTAELTTVGQTLNLDNATVNLTIGSAVTGPNTLLVKDTFAGKDSVVIDKEYISLITNDWYPDLAVEDASATGLVYGIDTIGFDDNFAFDTYPTLSDALTTTLGDEYLKITTRKDAYGVESTGCKIEVLAADMSTVEETYYFVYFGDINGDGTVENSDVTALVNWNRFNDTLNSVAAIAAADYNGDAFAENSDVTIIVNANRLGEGYPAQVELAPAFFAAYH